MMAQLLALIVLMAGAGTAAGAEFGRMFFTPAQRAALDHFRDLNIRSAAISDDDNDKDLVPPSPAPEQVSVNGIVRRSDGKNTVWINNRAVGAQQAPGILVAPGKDDNRVKLTVPQSGRSFELKVGQTADTVSGTVAEGYARRTLPTPANVTPGAEDMAPGAARVAPPPASRPVEPGKGPTRAGGRDARDDIRPDRGLPK
jgi:hypothetical protein